jgi:hypothetical protein
MISIACNNGLIMAGARVYYTMAQMVSFLRRQRKLNEAKFLLGLLDAVFLGFGFVSYWKIW